MVSVSSLLICKYNHLTLPHDRYRFLSFSFAFASTCFLLMNQVVVECLQTKSNGGMFKRTSVPSAIFIFGDSTSDPGNNNFIGTAARADFAPYGRDFANQVPTGRFTNGRLACDFIAKYVGLKDYVPPYLDPNLSIDALKTGVSFASAGTGFDPLTPKYSNVIPLEKQLVYFKEYQSKLESAIGKKKTEALVNDALYVISAGTNDYLISYYIVPLRRKTYDVPAYTDFLFQQIRPFMQGLIDLGARRIAFTGLAPMGCLPVAISLFSKHAITERGCIDSISAAGRNFNAILVKEMNAIQSKTSSLGTRIAILDVYKKTEDIINNPSKYGMEDVNSGCCGTGLLETSVLCNPKSPVCSDASKYFFFDSVHPTEKVYNTLVQATHSTIDFLVK